MKSMKKTLKRKIKNFKLNHDFIDNQLLNISKPKSPLQFYSFFLISITATSYSAFICSGSFQSIGISTEFRINMYFSPISIDLASSTHPISQHLLFFHRFPLLSSSLCTLRFLSS